MMSQNRVDTGPSAGVKEDERNFRRNSAVVGLFSLDTPPNPLTAIA